MSEAKSGDNHPMFGKCRSAETLAKISESLKGDNHPRGFLGKSHSAETLTRMSIAKGAGTIYVYDSQGSLVNTFSSAREAGKEFDTHHQTILKYARNGNIFKDKWKLSTSLITKG